MWQIDPVVKCRSEYSANMFLGHLNNTDWQTFPLFCFTSFIYLEYLFFGDSLKVAQYGDLTWFCDIWSPQSGVDEEWSLFIVTDCRGLLSPTSGFEQFEKWLIRPRRRRQQVSPKRLYLFENDTALYPGKVYWNRPSFLFSHISCVKPPSVCCWNVM